MNYIDPTPATDALLAIDGNLDLIDPLKGRIHLDNEREIVWQTLVLLRNEVERLQKELDQKAC